MKVSASTSAHSVPWPSFDRTLTAGRVLPDLVDKRLPRKDQTHVYHQALQQIEFHRGQVHLVPAHGTDPPVPIELYFVDGKHPAARLARWPAKDRLDSRGQLTDIEWLCQVVIRTQLQPQDLVGRAIEGGQHQDGSIAPGAQALEHLEAVNIGEHDVEDDKLERPAHQFRQCFAPTAGDFDLVAVLAKIVRDELDYRFLVVYQ